MQDWSRWGAVLAATGAAAAFTAPAEAQAWRFHADPVLGTRMALVAISNDRSAAIAAAQAARHEIDRLDALLSGWRSDSELSRLNRSAAMAVSPELYAVLDACERWRTATGGAFDARQGAVFARRRAGEQDPAVLARLAVAATDADVRLDPATRTVFRPEPVQFAPEALAKGYVVDRALAVARAAAPGLAGLMIDIGGDLRCWGEGPSGRGWTTGIAAPGDFADNAAPAVLVRTDGRALATSGPRGEGEDHIFGRRAGVQASVVAPTAAEADALATALCVMPADRGLALAARLPGVEARVVDAAGHVHTSTGWETLTVAPADPPARLIRAAETVAAPWPKGFVVAIDYALPKAEEEGRIYPPYVAIWITDANNQLVRGLTMLGGKLDYVSENYIWWRRYGRARPQLVAAISRPTKPAGRYSAVWDGKDDLGRAVGQGRYTVHVEATREHGLHSYQAMDLTLGGAPVQASAAPGDELGPAAVRYGRR